MPLSRWVMARLRYKLHVARRRLRKRATIQMIPRLGAQTLRSCSFFAKWPLLALSDLRREMVWEVYFKGEAVLYAREPRQLSSLFWIVSGELTEVMSGRERRGRMRVAEKEGGCVVPAADIEYARHTPSVFSYAGFSEELASFSAGRFAAGELLFLGLPYQRTIRCDTDVTGYAVSFAAIEKIQRRWNVPLELGVVAAKEIVKGQMVRRDEKPSLQLALDQNPILQNLDATTLNILWIRLFPEVMCNDEVICDNVFVSNKISFLESGSVFVGGKGGSGGKKITSRGGAIGLNSFVPTEVPHNVGTKSPAVAVTFTRLWTIGRKDFCETVSEKEWRKCAEFARRVIQIDHVIDILRRVMLFSLISRMKLDMLVKRTQLRLVRGGDYILAPHKTPEEAIVVLVGAVYFSAGGGLTKKALGGGEINGSIIPCGSPVAFAECIAEVPLKHGVLAATGAVILSLTRRVMMETLRENDSGPDVEGAVLEAAMDQLGVPPHARNARRIVTKGQEDALQRVRDYVKQQQEQHENNDNNNASSAPRRDNLQNRGGLPVNLDRQIVFHTQVLSTLAMQMHSLRPSFWREQSSGVQFDIASRCTMKKSPLNEAQKFPRVKSCFSLGEDGCIVFCSGGAQAEGRPERGAAAHSDGVVCGKEEEKQETPRRSPPIHLKSKNGFPRAPKAIPPLSALRCACNVKPVTVMRRSPVSQRVISLRKEGEKLQEDADNALSLPLACFLSYQRRRNPIL